MTDDKTLFCVESKSAASLIVGIQHVADSVHAILCSCGGIRWIDCLDEQLKSRVETLFRLDNWTLDHHEMPFRWGSDNVRVLKILSVAFVPQFDIPEFKFTIPLLPPSVNHYKTPNGHKGWFKTPEAKAFQLAVGMIANTTKAPSDWTWDEKGKFYEIDLTFYVHEKRFLSSDADNLEKVAFDALKLCRVISDDRYIKYHTNRTIPVSDRKQERTEYRIRAIPGALCLKR